MNRVTPRQRVERHGNVYEYKYEFKEVHIDEVDRIDVDGVTVEMGDGYLLYQYRGRTQVRIEQDGCYVEEGADMKDAENQAYYALSILDRKGLVSRWRKV